MLARASPSWLSRLVLAHQAYLYFPLLFFARIIWGMQSAVYLLSAPAAGTPLSKDVTATRPLLHPVAERAGLLLHWALRLRLRLLHYWLHWALLLRRWCLLHLLLRLLLLHSSASLRGQGRAQVGAVCHEPQLPSGIGLQHAHLYHALQHAQHWLPPKAAAAWATRPDTAPSSNRSACTATALRPKAVMSSTVLAASPSEEE